MSPPARDRRTVLRALATTVPLGVGGCAGTADETTPRSSRSNPCQADSPPTPAAGYPDRPDHLTERSAREYALAAERAYQQAVEPGFQSLRVDTGPAVTPAEDGFVVQFVAWLRTQTGGGETAVARMGDRFYTAQYAVTDAGVWRAETDSTGPLEDGPEPRTDGRAVVCF